MPFFASAGAGAVGFFVALFFLEESYHPEKIKAQKEKERHALSDVSDHDEEIDPESAEPLTSKKALEVAGNGTDHKQMGACAKMVASFKAIPIQVWLVLKSYFLSTVECPSTAPVYDTANI